MLQYWKLLVVGAVLGATIGAAVALRRPTLYQASTTVLVSHGNPQAATTSRALLESHTLAEQTLRETGLDQPPFHLTPQAFVRGALQIEQVSGGSLVKVNVTLPDPVKAAEASRIVAQKAVELSRQIAGAEAVAVRSQLAEHVDAAEKRLTTSEQELLRYREEAQLEVLKADTGALLDERRSLLKLLVEVEAEKARLAAAEREIEKQEPLLSLPRSVDGEEALRTAAQRSAANVLEATATGLGGALDLSHPFVNPVHQTLSFQIATSRTRLAGLERQRRELVVVRKLGDGQLDRLSELYQRELALARLEAQHDLAKRVHAELALLYEKSRTDSLIRMALLQVIDVALPPDRPLARKRVQSTALGLVIGLVLAILCALALAWMPRPRTTQPRS